MLTHVPSTKPPEYAVAKQVNLVPINKLAEVKSPWKRYVVIGAGKTGIDALLYLLQQNTPPENILWIVSNDCWMLLRDLIMPRKSLKNFKYQLFPNCVKRCKVFVLLV